MNWWRFWWQNWFVVPILALCGLALYAMRGDGTARWQRVLIFLPFIVIFAIGNLFLLQPWEWDNTKLLSWASIGFSGLAAYALHALWRAAAASRGRSLVCKLLAGALLLGAISAGALDAVRVARTDTHQYPMYSGEEMALAAWVKENTPARSIWLTGNNHNHWLINLTGRQTLMAFDGWLWSHGYDYALRASEVKIMYEIPGSTVYDKFGVNYIVLGPNERSKYAIDQAEFERRFKVVRKTDNYVILQTGG